MEGNGGNDGKRDSNALTLKVIRVRTRIASSVRTGVWINTCGLKTDPTTGCTGDNVTMGTKPTVCS